MAVPFLDIRIQDDQTRSQIVSALTALVQKTNFIGGPEVEGFTKEFGDYCGGRCVTVANGTDALILALRALGIGAGDEVITVPFTFIATAEAISNVGATVKFVDIDPKTYNMDVTKIAAAITPKTRAIMPVHLFGQVAEMDAILKIAREKNLKVIEDACQAHGGEYRGRRAGSFGDAAAFSFYPTKNLGGLGDGGAIIVQSPDLAAKISQIADHGRLDRYRHAVEGVNSRLDAFQAAGLRVKLRQLPARNDRRRAIAAAYQKGLSGLPFVVTPTVPAHIVPVWHLYCVESPNRDALMEHLKAKGIGCGVYYPIPLHLQPAYARLGLAPGAFPASERASERILALPMFPEMTDAHVAEVIDAVTAFSPPR